MSDFETRFEEYYTRAADLFELSGSADAAYEYIRRIEDEDYRNRTLESMACLLARRDQVVEAFRFCSAIERPLGRADAFFEVGRELAKKNNAGASNQAFSEAIKAAEAIEHQAADTAALLLQVASELKLLGQRDESLRLVRRATELARPKPQSFEAGKTLRGCARALAKWNLLAEAIEVAQSIELRELRSTALEEIQGRGTWPVYPDPE